MSFIYVDKIAPYQIAGIKVKNIFSGTMLIEPAIVNPDPNRNQSRNLTIINQVETFNFQHNFPIDIDGNCVLQGSSDYIITMSLNYELINGIEESKTFTFFNYLRGLYFESLSGNPNVNFTFNTNSFNLQINGTNCIYGDIYEDITQNSFITLNNMNFYNNIKPDNQISIRAINFNNITTIDLSNTTLNNISIPNSGIIFLSLYPVPLTTSGTFTLNIENTPFLTSINGFTNLSNLVIRLNATPDEVSGSSLFRLVRSRETYIVNSTSTQYNDFVTNTNNIEQPLATGRRWFVRQSATNPNGTVLLDVAITVV